MNKPEPKARTIPSWSVLNAPIDRVMVAYQGKAAKTPAVPKK